MHAAVLALIFEANGPNRYMALPFVSILPSLYCLSLFTVVCSRDELRANATPDGSTAFSNELDAIISTPPEVYKSAERRPSLPRFGSGAGGDRDLHFVVDLEAQSPGEAIPLNASALRPSPPGQGLMYAAESQMHPFPASNDP